MTDDEREIAIQIEYELIVQAIFPKEKREHLDKMQNLIADRSAQQVARMEKENGFVTD